MTITVEEIKKYLQDLKELIFPSPAKVQKTPIAQDRESFVELCPLLEREERSENMQDVIRLARSYELHISSENGTDWILQSGFYRDEYLQRMVQHSFGCYSSFTIVEETQDLLARTRTLVLAVHQGKTIKELFQAVEQTTGSQRTVIISWKPFEYHPQWIELRTIHGQQTQNIGHLQTVFASSPAVSANPDSLADDSEQMFQLFQQSVSQRRIA